MKTITFLMPSGAGNPSGGFKVVFEYANRFVLDGNDVHIVFPATLLWYEQPVKEKLKSFIRFFYHKFTHKYKPYAWFKLSPKVKLHFIWSLKQHFIPKTDIYIATAIETSEYLLGYKNINMKNKYYFIQGYESWTWGEKRFLSSLKNQLNKITISEHLLNVIQNQGYDAVLIHNGFDFNYFKMCIPIQEKNKYRITMLYHTMQSKGIPDGLRALEIVKRQYPQLRVSLFGFCPCPNGLPEWIDYYQKPDQETHNKIYNESAIFLGPSHSEGFCLTPPEAMQCGCAVVCTDIGGYTVVCKDNYNALTSPAKYPEGLATNILRLIENDELRYSIAETGYKYIKQFTWERAYKKLCKVIDN